MNDLDFHRFISNFHSALQAPLPGEQAQYEMAPLGRPPKKEALKAQEKPPKKSAVLALFYPDGKQVKTVLMRRTAYPGVHSGQISFPGGRLEDEDRDLSETALRETEEEIGIDRRDIELLGQMTDLFIPPSGFHVTPYIGFVENTPLFKPDPKEVEELLFPGIGDLVAPRNKTESHFPSGLSGVEIKAPCIRYGNSLIWGATAMMISEMNAIVNAILNPKKEGR